MPITKIEEKESPNKEKCWFKVIVAGLKGEEEEKVFKEGARIHDVLKKLQVLDFRVNHGLPVKKSFPPYYFFIVECSPQRKDITRETIKEVSEPGGELYHEY